MKLKNKQYLFNLYTYYWVLKLGLNKKYVVTVGIDRRYDCMAITTQISYNEYHIVYNPRRHHSEASIIHTVLHEIGHLLHSWNGNSICHEEYAEKFALEIAKNYYPIYYRKFVNKIRNDIKKKKKYPDHIKAFKRVLKQLGE